jgi:hypothetical protein
MMMLNIGTGLVGIGIFCLALESFDIAIGLFLIAGWMLS